MPGNTSGHTGHSCILVQSDLFEIQIQHHLREAVHWIPLAQYRDQLQTL